MTLTVVKITYEKLKSKITNYRDYKNFFYDRFRQILLEKLSTENINATYIGIEMFLRICINKLNMLAACKKKYTSGNSMPFMNKSLTRAYMKRSRLRNLYLKSKLTIAQSPTLSNATTLYLFSEELKNIIT